MKITCELRDYSEPAQPSIKVNAHWNLQRFVELEIEGKKYTVLGQELIEAVKNCMNSYAS